MKKKKAKMELIKIQNFCTYKDTIKKMKSQETEDWKKKCVKHTSDHRHVPRIHMELVQPTCSHTYVRGRSGEIWLQKEERQHGNKSRNWRDGFQVEDYFSQEILKEAKNRLLPGAAGRNQTGRHLHFGLLRFISDFWPPQPQENKFGLFSVTECVSFVTATTGN